MDDLYDDMPFADLPSAIPAQPQPQAVPEPVPTISPQQELASLLDFRAHNPEKWDKKPTQDKRVRLSQRLFNVTYSLVELESVEGGKRTYFIRDNHSIPYHKINGNQLDRFITELHTHCFGDCNPEEYSRAQKLIKQRVDKIIPNVPKQYIYIGNTLVWDCYNNEIVDFEKQYPEGDFPDVFFRFFDTSKGQGDKHTVELPGEPITSDEAEYITALSDKVYSRLRINDGQLKDDTDLPLIKPILEWADGDTIRYGDIMGLIAGPIVAKKPFGVWTLIGEKRNGKSALVGMVRSLYGVNNCTQIKSADVGDWHYQMTLKYALFNAPDEDPDVSFEKDSDIFKTMADHGSLSLKVMAGQEPVNLNCDFVMALPMNHLPEFKGSDSGALAERLRVIRFLHDFSDSDDSRVSFAEATFTREFLINLLAHTLGWARFHNERGYEKSSVMKSDGADITDGASAGYAFFDLFKKYFYGFTDKELILTELDLYCKQMGYETPPESSLSLLFKRYEKRRTTIKGVKVNVFTEKGVSADNCGGRRIFSLTTVSPTLAKKYTSDRDHYKTTVEYIYNLYPNSAMKNDTFAPFSILLDIYDAHADLQERNDQIKQQRLGGI